MSTSCPRRPASCLALLVLLTAACSSRVDAGHDRPTGQTRPDAAPVERVAARTDGPAAGPSCADCPRLWVNVGIITMGGTPWALEDNFARLEAYVREAVRRRAQLVIAPEAILDGYVCGTDPTVTRERMFTVAQRVPDGPYLRRVARLCRELQIYLVFGFLEKAGDDLFNSCALFDPKGDILAKYSKVHPANESFITPGRELRTFDTPFGRVGFLICSDRGIVDNFSTLGAQGAEIILLPMDGGGGHENTAVLRQRARDNYCSIVVANTWSAAIIDPRGEATLEKYESECVSVGRLYTYDLPRGEKRGRFLERRPDLYGPLTQPGPTTSLFDSSGRPTSREEERRATWRKNLRDAKTGEPLR
jgi:predicted amidohydrolase